MSKRVVRPWCLMGLVWMVAMGGCGDDGGDPSGGSGGSQTGGSSGHGTGGTSTSPCGDCAGCCDGSTCLPLASQNTLSCGRNGGTCATCGNYSKCFKGICQPDDAVCSPLTCASGCCMGNLCVTESAWTSCSQGGTTCQTCEPMALCTDQTTCDNTQWAPDALLDLYIEQYSVSEAQCSDPIGAPDPQLSLSILGKSYTSSVCDDSYSCTFNPPWKIANVPLKQFQLGLVSFSIVDVDEASDDPCWGSSLVAPAKRDFSSKILKPGDGTLTYHVRPAGH